MRKLFRSSLAIATVAVLGACAPSPAEVTQQVEAAVNAKNADAALALLAPEAAGELKGVLQDLIAKNAKVELVGQYKVEGTKLTAVEKVTTDEYTKLGVAPVDMTLEAAAVKGKLTAYKLDLTPESKAKVDGALAQIAKKVIDEFEAAVGAKNMDAVLALMADNASFTCADGKVFNGKADIKAHFEGAFAQNATFEKGERQVAGDKVTWMTKIGVDDWKKAKISPLDAQGQAVVQNGKLMSMSFTLTPDAAAKLEKLNATASAKAKKM